MSLITSVSFENHNVANKPNNTQAGTWTATAALKSATERYTMLKMRREQYEGSLMKRTATADRLKMHERGRGYHEIGEWPRRTNSLRDCLSRLISSSHLKVS